jgi:hypothetical protein
MSTLTAGGDPNWGAGLPPGIGNAQQATQATAAMRNSPWYQALVKTWGLDPDRTDENGNLVDQNGKSVKLSDQQQQQLIAAARDSGIGISNSYNIDENGQIAKPDSHMLRNIGIAAGIAGLALTGLGAAGIGPLGGLLGGGASAAAGGAEAAGGVLPSTTIGSGFIPAIAGTVPSGAVGAAEAAGGGSLLSSIGGALKGGSTLSNILGGAGSAIGKADTASQNNDLLRGAQNIEGTSAFENELMNRAKEEAAQRNTALKDVYLASYANNPPASPYDVTGGPKYSSTYLNTINNLSGQGASVLANPAQYATANQPKLQPYTPIQPSTLQKAGDWLSPGLTIGSQILKAF